MGLQSAAVLYPVNSTQVDGGFIRLLDSAQAAATDTTQTVTATHTQDAQKRTFSPATLGVTANQGAGGYRGLGYALRLSQDMTPTDDTNCNAALQSATFTLNISVAINQAGGTYTTGTYGPQWEMRLYTYDPVANTGTAINLTSVNSATTWNIAPVGGDLGTFKTVSISCTFADSSLIEFVQGNILLLQIGLDTLTIPNPTLGTATWTYTLAVDDPNTNITWAAGQAIAAICGMAGASAGSCTPLGLMAIVLPTAGASAGVGTALGTLEAAAELIGTCSGTSTATGSVEAKAEMSGSAFGAAAVVAVLEAVAAMAGTAQGIGAALASLVADAELIGTAAGTATVLGSLEADAETTGTAAGVASGSGSLGGVAETAGLALGFGDATGALSAVVPTVGTVEIGVGGSAELPTGLMRLNPATGRVEALGVPGTELPTGALRLVQTV